MQSLEQTRTAHREHLLRHQGFDVDLRIVAGPVADTDIDLLASEIDQSIGRIDTYIDPRVRGSESIEAR